MRRLSTLTVLAIFSPVMCVISLAVFTVLEVLAKHRRNAKYRSGLSGRVEQEMVAKQESIVDYMIRTGVTPSEYVERLHRGTL